MLWKVILVNVLCIGSYVGHKLCTGGVANLAELREQWVIIPIVVLLDGLYWAIVIFPNRIIERNRSKMAEAVREAEYPPLRLT